MFSLTEVASLNDIQPTYRILKPWWDVFMDYIGVIMLMLAIFSGTMQLSKDQVACLPILENQAQSQSINPKVTQNPPVLDFSPSSTKDIPNSVVHDIDTSHSVDSHQPEPKGLKTNLDFQQYVFINQMCYHDALPWYSKYFPYLALIHTIVLMVSSNFWFKYPKTSSKIEHFVSILGRCFESPWTTKALSETAFEDSEGTKQKISSGTNFQKSASSDSKEDSSQSTPLLEPSAGHLPKEKLSPDAPSLTTILDKKDGEQAKALFEKVRKFRAHVEDSDLIYKLYVAQTVIKAVKIVLILSYTSTFAANIKFSHICEPKVQHLTGYNQFFCTHNMAFMFRKLLYSFMAMISLYGLVCLYTLYWLFRTPLKQYSFEKVREESIFSDIPDVKNDFAFLLYMVDQYDKLYSKRFGVFLSGVSESKLREISLNHEWTYDKLRQSVTTNAQNEKELFINNRLGLPNAVFDLTDLQILKLEIPEVRISAKVSQMASLRELHLYNCPAKVERTAFIFLRDHLRRLHIMFTDVGQIPSWIYLLRNLKELYLIGNLNSEHNKIIGFESLRDLKHLKTLCFNSNLSKIPTNLTELSTHLTKLMVHNRGSKLSVLNSLKKMTSLVELELHNCDLERLPDAISSLINLQELDLKHNSIPTIEEVIHFQNLKRLVCLKLWHNEIIAVPSSIDKVMSLESLIMPHNKLLTLPSALFRLPKLRHIDLSHNTISSIPGEVENLQNLQHFAITGNRLEVLPSQLFKCIKLRVLCVGHNSIMSIPDAIGQLTQLSHLELKGNRLEGLPSELDQCSNLHKSAFIIEDHLFEALPTDVKKKFCGIMEK